MRVLTILERSAVFGVRQILSVLSGRACTRFMSDYYRRRGMKVLGTPNYISARAWFDGTDYALIELNEGCTISGDVKFLTHDWAVHTIGRGIGLSPCRPLGCVRPIRVGRYSFIGMGSFLMPGATIGDCVIVGARSVVRGNVPDYAIVTGNPARQVGDSREYLVRQLARLGDAELLRHAEHLIGDVRLGGDCETGPRRAESA